MSNLDDLEILDCVLKSLTIVWEEDPEYEPPDDAFEFFDADIYRGDESFIFQVDLRFGHYFEDEQLHVGVNLVGTFGVPSEYEEAPPPEEVFREMLSVMYNTMRGYLVTTTSLFPSTPVVMPLFDPQRTGKILHHDSGESRKADKKPKKRSRKK